METSLWAGEVYGRGWGRKYGEESQVCNENYPRFLWNLTFQPFVDKVLTHPPPPPQKKIVGVYKMQNITLSLRVGFSNTTLSFVKYLAWLLAQSKTLIHETDIYECLPRRGLNGCGQKSDRDRVCAFI